MLRISGFKWSVSKYMKQTLNCDTQKPHNTSRLIQSMFLGKLGVSKRDVVITDVTKLTQPLNKPMT